jgi:mono/diheme cytochrome c family protein
MLRPILFAALLAVPAWAQKDLPEGAGKQTTVRVCTSCHGAEMFSATRLGKAEWDSKIANMTTERGVAITDGDYATVLKYLSTYLGPAPKANLNEGNPNSKDAEPK